MFALFYRSRQNPVSISLQLLLAVNTILGIAIFALLYFRYSSQMQIEVRKKHQSLNDEALTIHLAIDHLHRTHNTADIQEYIDSICERMWNESASCHNVVVQLDGRFIQSKSDQRHTSVQIASIAEAAISPSHQSRETPYLIVASYSSNGLTVYTSENLAGIQRAAWQDIKLQIFWLGFLGGLAALIVNIVLLRIVGEPLQVLLRTVNKISSGDFSSKAPDLPSLEMNRLSHSINAMSEKLLWNERERAAQLTKAQQIQRHLLPGEIRITGIRTSHLFRPADIVAGDYYDFVPLKDGRWLICLADVTGHGIPAAMGATMLKSFLLTAAEESAGDPAELLALVNQRFSRLILPDNFASMFLACWNSSQRELSWASAGHDSGILLQANSRVGALESTGTLLGIDEDASWLTKKITLSSGNRLLLFSDGASETANPQGEIFSRRRLTQVFRSLSHLSISDSLHDLDDQLQSFRGGPPLNDDLTMVALEVE
ncbi:MAG: PP2C family protein-serine/threonine phosphatase [Rubinisphaera brasiliensis]|uniref:PP2C family protein-serine/threonine phosphatase n=1 Tax=Rubinisphaera brasiliensis TaxID=119 RepID=UPI003918B3BA